MFADRFDAGRRLGAKLAQTLGQRVAGNGQRGAVVVLGLPRGGVPVAFEVARALRAPLDVFIVRKVGVPGHAEFAMGAIASGGVRVVNDSVMQGLGISQHAFDAIAALEAVELDRRERTYREGRAPIPLQGSTSIIVDDGVATGASMIAAARAVRQLGAAEIIAATPLIASDAIPRILEVAEECVALDSLDELGSVGAGYVDFAQTTDEEVRALLTDTIPAAIS
jgi:putative phosphoribosyl transferase